MGWLPILALVSLSLMFKVIPRESSLRDDKVKMRLGFIVRLQHHERTLVTFNELVLNTTSAVSGMKFAQSDLLLCLSCKSSVRSWAQWEWPYPGEWQRVRCQGAKYRFHWAPCFHKQAAEWMSRRNLRIISVKIFKYICIIWINKVYSLKYHQEFWI